MNKLKKSFIAAAAVSSIGIASLGGTIAANAQGEKSDNLIDKIASKFNLNKDEVKKVFDEERSARQAEFEKKQAQRLDQAVADAKITSEQKDLITKKLAELKQFRYSLDGKTVSERKEALKNKRQETIKWAKDNNIPLRYLGPMAGPHHGRHFGDEPDQNDDM